MSRILITGGAGFIGCNAARRFMSRGDEVVVVDDLSRKGTDLNLAWLREEGSFEFIQADIRDGRAMRDALGRFRDLDAVLHLAAQVAVTTSVADPRADFEINALGTLNVLEAVREAPSDPVVIYASTNKVYGGMDDVAVEERNGRYGYRDLPGGVSEDRRLDFHSPYGCSKGAADQYVRDYGRIYGLRTVVFRQSCIYGYRQFGVEDQGWVAWFTIAAVLGRPIVLYGDGKQVRDLLFIDDLVNAYELAVARPDRVSGRIYNLGGGPENVLSLLELLAMLRELTGGDVAHSFDEWRPGDQRVFVSDIGLAGRDLGWKPEVGAAEGVRRLHGWVVENRPLLEKVLA
ncbi:MAG: SDR family NAD(P)-dependent oxidoreductase [Nitrospinota bacterium]